MPFQLLTLQFHLQKISREANKNTTGHNGSRNLFSELSASTMIKILTKQFKNATDWVLELDKNTTNTTTFMH